MTTASILPVGLLGWFALAEGAQAALPDGATIEARLSDLAPAKRLDA